MHSEGVFLASGGLICHAGRGLKQVSRNLRVPQIKPCEYHIDEIKPAITAHYLPALFEGPGNRMVSMAEAAVADALSEFSIHQRADMPLFVASSTPDLLGREPDYTEALKRNERTVTLTRPSAGRLASKIARDCELGGGQYTINTACSSGANALLYAAAAIRRGDCRHALVLGIEGPSRVTLAGFSSLMLASKSRCRPFDRDRDGLMLGETAAAIVLSAEPGNGPLRGMRLLGGATACDSANATQTDAGSVSEIIREAMRDAQVENVDAIKAHGTGTPRNDSAEAQGIVDSLGAHKLPVTSLKSALGHTLGACGVLETVAIAACWRDGFLAPTAGFQTPDPDLALTPITQATAMAPGRMLLNYFGFGGNNSALVMEYAA